jgi:hypothetical protein
MCLEEFDGSCSTALQDLPPHLQHLIFASAAAPLTICKASAAVAQEASLIATWLLAKNQHPLQTAVQIQLWDVCSNLFSMHQYIPDAKELRCCLIDSARKGATAVVATLLQWCWKQQHPVYDMRQDLLEALCLAASNGHVATCQLLLQQPCITAQGVRWAVRDAAAAGQLDVMQLLMTSRPDAASPDLYGNPMCAAAERGNLEAMQLLLQHGADIDGGHGTP